jgi:2-oxoglutarate ferredoxin oxidoreductase subunit alpha
MIQMIWSNKLKCQKNVIITGFTSYTAKKFVNDNKEFWLIIIKFLKPLDNRLKEELIWKQEIIFVENNYSGQIENYITKELSLNNNLLINSEWNKKLKISHLRKYDLFPFYIEDFESLKE